MTTLYDMFFLLQFIVIIVIILVKLYNVMSLGETYDIRISILLFIGYFIAYGVAFVVFLLDPEELLYLQLFRLESWLIVLNVVFLMAELFFNFKRQGLTPIKANMSNPMFNKKKHL